MELDIVNYVVGAVVSVATIFGGKNLHSYLEVRRLMLKDARAHELEMAKLNRSEMSREIRRLRLKVERIERLDQINKKWAETDGS